MQLDEGKSGQDDREELRENVMTMLRTIYDPEIPVNIVDLGLVYALDIDDEGNVDIEMTLTAPACPVAGSFPEVVASRVSEVPGINAVHVELVWEPPWSVDHVSEAARLELGLL